jgi:hypothetical protein
MPVAIALREADMYWFAGTPKSIGPMNLNGIFGLPYAAILAERRG